MAPTTYAPPARALHPEPVVLEVLEVAMSVSMFYSTYMFLSFPSTCCKLTLQNEHL